LRKFNKFFRCGVCGAKRPWEKLGQHHDFIIKVQAVGDGKPRREYFQGKSVGG
jgi:hypothetical protein